MIWILFLCHFALARQEPSVVYKNNQAVKLFENEQIIDSKNLLQKEVVDHPDESVLHFNLGLAHELSKDGDKALQEYTAALKDTQNSELKFQTLFNIAILYTEKEDIKNALKYYQLALDLKPDSKEVKTNIELLFKSNGGGKSQNQQKNNQDNKKNQDQNKETQNQQQQQQNGQDKQNKPQPQKFNSKDLSEQDVKRILEELKRQEEQIRAKINNQKTKETPVEKDW